ncbi:Pept_C1 domain-containing protein [Psidium guajava]|nr:Pept_C1 domain-containing protein [Psidium guajava]
MAGVDTPGYQMICRSAYFGKLYLILPYSETLNQC